MLLIILLLSFIILFFILHSKHFSIFIRDIQYFLSILPKNISKLIHNNHITNPTFKPLNILFITFDNRKNIPYIQSHNQNIKDYCEKWNYTYKFITNCQYNVYWSKIYLVEKYLNKYDYVIWLDSDTYIFNTSIDFGKIIQQYSSDIYLASDNHFLFDIANAGVFAIKNSKTGKQYLRDCLKNYKEPCVTPKKTLNGFWAASCYEQGTMNQLILNKYSNYTTLLSNDIILNTNKCSKKPFILHYYGSKDKDRFQCFNK